MKNSSVVISTVLLRLLALIALTPVETVFAGDIARIGYLSPLAREQQAPGIAAFLDGLRDFGYIEGKNVVIEWQFANGHADRLPALAAELVSHRVDLIAAVSTPAVHAAKRATANIPIAMIYATDAVEDGFAVSLAHPGGNVTGLSFMGVEGASKQLELLKAAVPSISRVAVGRLPTPDHRRIAGALAGTGEQLGVTIKVVEIRGAEDYDHVFGAMKSEGVQGVLLLGTPVHYPYRARLAELAIKHRLPMVSSLKEFGEAGFLLSYSPNILHVYRYIGKYIDKLLKGEQPGDIPIEQPTQFELVINLRTAKALGVQIPSELLLRADEVIR